MPRTVFFVARTAQEVVEEIFYVFEGGDFGRCIRGDELRFLPSTDMCAGHKPGPMPRDGPHEARPHGVRHSQWNQTRALTFANSMALAQSQATPALHQTHHNIHTFTSSARQPPPPATDDAYPLRSTSLPIVHRAPKFLFFSKTKTACLPPAARAASCSTPSHIWPARAWHQIRRPDADFCCELTIRLIAVSWLVSPLSRVMELAAKRKYKRVAW